MAATRVSVGAHRAAAIEFTSAGLQPTNAEIHIRDRRRIAGFGRLAEWVAGSGQPSRLRRNEKHEDALSNMMLNGKSRYRLWVGEAHSKTGPVQNPKPRHFKPFEFF